MDTILTDDKSNCGSQLCYKCNNLYEHIEVFTVKNRRFGSIFQDDCFSVQLCNDCKKLIVADWFNNTPISIKGDFFIYDGEHELNKFMKSFPIENQEYVYNCDNYMLPKIDREEWIKLNSK